MTESPVPEPFVSVVIPVYRGVQSLSHCLAALARQSYPADRFEVLVVDNDAPAERSRYANLVAVLSQARLLWEPTPGAYAARNRGIREAKGDLLAFTDADCVPDSHWLREGVRRWRELTPESVVAGRIELRLGKAVPGAVELFDVMFLGFPQEVFAREDHFSATANMFCGRAAFEKAGCFDENLLSAGDYEWGRRAHALGLGIHFEPAAVVEHPARASLRSIFLKIRRQTGGAWLMKRRAPKPPSLRQGIAAETHRWIEMRRAVRASKVTGSATRRWKLVALVTFLQAVRVAETLRLAAGGRPKRA